MHHNAASTPKDSSENHTSSGEPSGHASEHSPSPETGNASGHTTGHAEEHSGDHAGGSSVQPHADDHGDHNGHGEHQPAVDPHADHGTMDHSQHEMGTDGEHSVIPPNDGSVPDVSGHVHPVAEPDSKEAGVTEHLGEKISSPIFFTTSEGKRVAIHELLTTPVLIVPVYYSCPGVCHILMSSIAGVLPSVTLTPETEYKVIMVSFDEFDTPKLAAKKKKDFLYALRRADPNFPAAAWLFLTGDKQNIDLLMGELGFRFKRVGKDFVHPVILVAVAPDGVITRYLYGTKVLPFDVTMALTEGDTDAPLFSVQRIAQLCFSYDPQGKKYVFDTMRVAGVGVLLFVILLAAMLFLGGRKKKPRN